MWPKKTRGPSGSAATLLGSLSVDGVWSVSACPRRENKPPVSSFVSFNPSIPERRG